MVGGAFIADIFVLLVALGTAVVALIVKAYDIVQKKVPAPSEGNNEPVTSETPHVQIYESKIQLTRWGRYSLALIIVTFIAGVIKAGVAAASSDEARKTIAINAAKQAEKEAKSEANHLKAIATSEKQHREQLAALHERLDEAEAQLISSQRELIARTGRRHQDFIVTIETGSGSKARTIEPVRFRLIGDGGVSPWKKIRAHAKKFENGQRSEFPLIVEPHIGELQAIEIQKWKHNTDGWLLAKVEVRDAKEGKDFDGDLGSGFRFVDKTDAVADGWLEKQPIKLKRR